MLYASLNFERAQWKSVEYVVKPKDCDCEAFTFNIDGKVDKKMNVKAKQKILQLDNRSSI